MKKNKKDKDFFKDMFTWKNKSKWFKVMDVLMFIGMMGLNYYLWVVEKPKTQMQMEMAMLRLKEYERYENLNLNFTVNNISSNTTCVPCICLPSEGEVIG